ncbi:hypothetical protein [Dyadobacter sp. CY356]|uniref:hypothetical protein n=1 Tax=Dyadobacter sp. CY356 TaxID=2906442 RepID=UPI001F3E4C89|nr:hypothetical protein [Dyadobacter sp. CY356]MCF0058919.1 hypothetical protein [Dyadobacter sp. CY356]
MFKKLLAVICVCFVVFLAGCKGDDGAVGPAGPAGPAGATGATGATGADGSGSSAIILTTGAITGTGSGGDLSFALVDSLTADEEDFYDSGVAVLVYAKSLGVWWPLPGNVQFANSAVSGFTFVHGVDSGTFFVDIFTTGNSEGASTAPTRSFDDIRVVLLPDTGARLSADINWSSYDATIKALGLTDVSLTKTGLYKKK